MTKPILELRDIVKRYGSALGVGPVSLTVNEGEFLTLLGPSGCGKTTTLHIIAGLLQPDQGAVTMGERDITSLAPPYRDMGLVFQNYALFPHKSVFDNIAFGLRMRKVPREEIARRVTQILDVVGLPGVEQRYPDQLSGGQRQRVALARALVIEPGVLLLDEPLSNLDALLRKRMRLELRDIQKRLGITTIFVTHDQDEAFEMSDRVVLLNHGQIAQAGTPESLYDAPVSRFVAEFIGEASLIEGRVVAQSNGVADVEIAGGVRLPARPTREGIAVGHAVLVLLRPERVDLEDAAPTDRSAIHARIEKRIFSGDRVTFELRTQQGERIVCNKPSLARFRDLPAERWVWAVPGECRALAAEHMQ